jgi:hypothetical protein
VGAIDAADGLRGGASVRARGGAPVAVRGGGPTWSEPRVMASGTSRGSLIGVVENDPMP